MPSWSIPHGAFNKASSWRSNDDKGVFFFNGRVKMAKILDRQFTAIAEQNRSVVANFQLAHISRSSIFLQQGHGLR